MPDTLIMPLFVFQVDILIALIFFASHTMLPPPRIAAYRCSLRCLFASARSCRVALTRARMPFAGVYATVFAAMLPLCAHIHRV